MKVICQPKKLFSTEGSFSTYHPVCGLSSRQVAEGVVDDGLHLRSGDWLTGGQVGDHGEVEGHIADLSRVS